MMAMIERAATNPDTDVGKMERLWDMLKEQQDRSAKMAYNAAMKACQAGMPVIPKDAENRQTNSNYSRLETIIGMATPVYTNHGFSLSFAEGPQETEGTVHVTCDVSHEAGDTRHYFYHCPIDDKGIKGTTNKTAPHAKASAIHYGQRYLIGLIFNLQLGGDDDGNAAGGDTRSAMEIENGWIEYMTQVRELLPSVWCIKQAIGDNDLSTAVQAWGELSADEHKVLWRAPTKGGIFTTQERTVMKSDEWGATRKAEMGE